MKSDSLKTCINNKLEQYFHQLEGENISGVHKMTMDEVESLVIKFTLEKSNNNQSKAAKILGLSRTTLKKKIQLYNL